VALARVRAQAGSVASNLMRHGLTRSDLDRLRTALVSPARRG